MNGQWMHIQYTDLEQWIIIICSYVVIVCTVYAMLSVPSEDILKAIAEKKRLDKLNGVRK